MKVNCYSCLKEKLNLFIFNCFPDHKHFVSYELWPWATYPYYMYGASILISGSAISPLLNAIKSTPYFPFDDLYVLGICANKAKVKLLTSDRFEI